MAGRESLEEFAGTVDLLEGGQERAEVLVVSLTDLVTDGPLGRVARHVRDELVPAHADRSVHIDPADPQSYVAEGQLPSQDVLIDRINQRAVQVEDDSVVLRSEEHTSELQSLM